MFIKKRYQGLHSNGFLSRVFDLPSDKIHGYCRWQTDQINGGLLNNYKNILYIENFTKPLYYCKLYKDCECLQFLLTFNRYIHEAIVVPSTVRKKMSPVHLTRMP